MERGAQALIKALLAALLFGGLVLAFHSDYRSALRAAWLGTPSDSPVWNANALYYPMVSLPAADQPPSPRRPEGRDLEAQE